MRMKNYSLLHHLSAAVLCLFMPLMVCADIDKKFYDKAANYVWGASMPQFDAYANLSDSIFQNQSAVYIARYYSLDADLDQTADAAKLNATGVEESNATKAVYLRRTMVKLNDAAAVEKFSEFEIDAPVKEGFGSYTVIEIRTSFGARITKPDGTVNTIGSEEAFTLTKGKEEKDGSYKFALPGLNPGDVLDYFIYTEYFFDELSMPGISVPLLGSYPTRSFIIDFKVDEKLSMEYGAFNGAPQLSQFGKIDNSNQFLLELQNIDALNRSTPYFSFARQMPFYDFKILNNKARLEFVPLTARAPGMRMSNYGFLLADVASAIRTCKYPDNVVGKAMKIIADWRKLNPGADGRQEVNAAWMALRYALYNTGEKVNDLQFARMFYQILDKLQTRHSYRIGFTASRREVPVKSMVSYKDVSYMVMVGDSCYFSTPNMLLAPGEMPANYDKETYLLFNVAPDRETLQNNVEEGEFPATQAPRNGVQTRCDISLDPDDIERLLVKTDLIFKGTEKAHTADIISNYELLDAMETYLGQKQSKNAGKIDRVAEAESVKEGFDNLARIIWDSKECSVTDYTVSEFGCIPGADRVVTSISGTVDGAVSRAGDNLLINIGRFIGEQRQISGSDRRRDVSILFAAPMKYDYDIEFTIPAGYTLAEESLADFTKSVNTADASFNTQVRVEGDKIIIRAVERYPRSVYAPSSWQNILDVKDALYLFCSATVVLVPVK